MKILKPIQNKNKKRLEIFGGNRLLTLPKVWIQNVPACSFKTIYMDLPIISIAIVLQK